MGELAAWGTRVIQWVQTFSSPTLDVVFRGLTCLGEEQFYLLLVPLLYWCIDKFLAMHLAFVYLGSAYVNTTLKAVFAVPRPSPSQVRVVTPTEGYSFPSGHAQTASVGWSYLAIRVRKAWFWLVATLLVLGVSLSRVYLGVHYPQDVIAGTLLGLVIALGYHALAGRIGSRVTGLPLWAKVGLACAVPLLLLALHVEDDTVASMGTLLGLGVGVVLEREWIRFRTAGPLFQRALRLVLGLVVMLAIYLGLKRVFPAGPLFRGVRYALVGLWASLGAPWLFVKLRVAERE